MSPTWRDVLDAMDRTEQRLGARLAAVQQDLIALRAALEAHEQQHRDDRRAAWRAAATTGSLALAGASLLAQLLRGGS